MLQRLNLEFNRFEPGRLVAFGSYAAGLYLPTGDMDLVFLQNKFKPGSYGPNGLPPPPPKRMLYKFADIIRDNRLAQPGSLNMILHAKVPIIKFVERLTGLKIDLSFNNDSGIVANETFEKWKVAYPAMPVIVSVVKHFLMIRGLNDVAVGGLGGFSIICLVTSLVQHLPFTTSPTNLGQVLVEFFNLYGNLLDREAVAIRLDPPGYIDKVMTFFLSVEHTDALTDKLQAPYLQQRQTKQIDHHRSKSTGEQHIRRHYGDRDNPGSLRHSS